MNKVAVLEGLLFVVGDEGITVDEICKIMDSIRMKKFSIEK